MQVTRVDIGGDRALDIDFVTGGVTKWMSSKPVKGTGKVTVVNNSKMGQQWRERETHGEV